MTVNGITVASDMLPRPLLRAQGKWQCGKTHQASCVFESNPAKCCSSNHTGKTMYLDKQPCTEKMTLFAYQIRCLLSHDDGHCHSGSVDKGEKCIKSIHAVISLAAWVQSLLTQWPVYLNRHPFPLMEHRNAWHLSKRGRNAAPDVLCSIQHSRELCLVSTHLEMC